MWFAPKIYICELLDSASDLNFPFNPLNFPLLAVISCRRRWEIGASWDFNFGSWGLGLQVSFLLLLFGFCCFFNYSFLLLWFLCWSGNIVGCLIRFGDQCTVYVDGPVWFYVTFLGFFLFIAWLSAFFFLGYLSGVWNFVLVVLLADFEVGYRWIMQPTEP